jgi:hypothetical protein
MAFKIPRDLLSTAFLSASGEPAWSKDDVLQVISWATNSQIAVFGVEVWLPTTPGPTIPSPYIYTFEPTQHEGANWNEFVKRANGDSIDYVRNFDWDPADKAHHGLTPYFNLTLGDH